MDTATGKLYGVGYLGYLFVCKMVAVGPLNDGSGWPGKPLWDYCKLDAGVRFDYVLSSHLQGNEVRVFHFSERYAGRQRAQVKL